jgi:hypothetical protein
MVLSYQYNFGEAAANYTGFQLTTSRRQRIKVELKGSIYFIHAYSTARYLP